METTPSVAAPMIQLGILLGIVLVGHAVAVRRLPTEVVPGCLMGRVRLANKMRPWLAVAAFAITAAGVILHLG